jgi:hypothetical protein
LLGKIGRVVQVPDRALVDTQVLVDFLGVSRIERLDDGLESDVPQNSHRDEHTEDDEKAADDPAQEAQRRPEQHRSDESEFSANDILHALIVHRWMRFEAPLV